MCTKNLGIHLLILFYALFTLLELIVLTIVFINAILSLLYSWAEKLKRFSVFQS